MAVQARSIADVNRVVHEPARLVILTMLNSVDSADFLYLLRVTGLTKGNLSSHLSRLEGAGYIQIEKTFQGKIPLTVCRLTQQGREAYVDYLADMKQLAESVPH